MSWAEFGWFKPSHWRIMPYRRCGSSTAINENHRWRRPRTRRTRKFWWSGSEDLPKTMRVQVAAEPISNRPVNPDRSGSPWTKGMQFWKTKRRWTAKVRTYGYLPPIANSLRGASLSAQHEFQLHASGITRTSNIEERGSVWAGPSSGFGGWRCWETKRYRPSIGGGRI